MPEKKRYARIGTQCAFPNPVPTNHMPAKKTTKKAAAKKTAVKAAPAKKAAAKKVAKTAGEDAPKKAINKAPRKAAVSSEAVAKAAYLNYRRRVEQDLPGDSHGDWLEAEKQLSQS